MKKLLKATILLTSLVAVLAWSDKSRYDITISELFEKSIASDDSTYMAIAIYRCSALLALVNGIKERDAGIVDDKDVSGELLKTGYYLSVAKQRERGVKVDLEKSMERAKQEYDRHYMKYKSWMTDNYDASGDYWGSHKDLQSEILDCTSIAQEIL